LAQNGPDLNDRILVATQTGVRTIRRISHVAIDTGAATAPQESGPIDQQFIGYLHAQPENLSRMHWRQFERLAGEVRALVNPSPSDPDSPPSKARSYQGRLTHMPKRDVACPHTYAQTCISPAMAVRVNPALFDHVGVRRMSAGSGLSTAYSVRRCPRII
jgi:hypothetical protein